MTTRFDTGLLSDASVTSTQEPPQPLEGIEIERQDGRINTLDGNSLYWWSYTPVVENNDLIIATVVFTHGYDDYTGRYADYWKFYAERGIVVYAVDLRGHGKSTGPRSLISSFQEYVDDYVLFVNFVKEKVDRAKPIFLSGHSNGGLTLAKALIDDVDRQEGICGAIFMSPYLELAVPVDFVTSIGAKVASFFAPRLMLENPCQDPGVLSTDPNAKAGEKGPEGSSGKVAVRFVTEAESAQKHVIEHASRIVLPCISMFGSDDTVAGPAATRRFHAMISSKDKSIVEYPGLRHELQFEIGKEKIQARLLRWITNRAKVNLTLVTTDARPSRTAQHANNKAKKQKLSASRERIISVASEASHEYKEAMLASTMTE